MLRLALDAHPALHVFDELLGYDVLMGDGRGLAQVADGVEMIGFKVPRWTDLLPGPTPGDPDQRFRSTYTYGGAPMLFIVRDVFDVVSSMASLRMTDEERRWLDLYGVPLLVHRLQRAPRTARRFAWVAELLERAGWEQRRSVWLRSRWRGVPRAWARLADRVGAGFASEGPEVDEARAAAGALYWRIKNEALARFRAADFPVMALAYEALVRDPERHLRASLTFLGCPWDDAVLHRRGSRHAELDDRGLAAGDTRPTRPIDASSVGRGQAELDEPRRQVIERVVEDLPARLARLIAQEGIADSAP